MPTYDYRCKRCGHRFSRFQRITAPAVRDCPNCSGKGTVERLISGGAGLIFKGSGFYITDYKKKNAPAESPSPSQGEKPAEKKKN